MYTVRQILQNKGHQVWSVSPEASVYEALQLMAEKDIGALVVMEADRLVGIFSERDYARKVILHGKTSRETRVREVMTPRVAVIKPEQATEECMALMTAKHIRHLPVMEDERLIGLISIGDVVKAVISKQEFVISQLENYITGGR
ncbi:MAG: CBS domain-containing protein [Anaerolineales bacterium]|jgi:CBS domain-containing protein